MGALLLHVGLTVWLSVSYPAAAQAIGPVFNVWVPVIAGLTSAAITFYFTRDK